MPITTWRLKGMEQSSVTDLHNNGWNGLANAQFLWYKSIGIWQVWQGNLPVRSLQALEQLLQLAVIAKQMTNMSVG